VLDAIGSNLAAIVLVLAGLCGLAVIMLQSLQISRMKQRVDALTGGAEGDLEAVLGQHLETVHEVGQDLDELAARMAVLESAGRHHFTKQGLIRFSPFEDTGGNQSFALALLDESDDGFIVSSLHSRTGTRIYAKVVSSGKADATTSPEETQAIEEARTRRGAGATAAGRAAASRTKAAAAAAVARPVPSTPVAAVAAPVAAPAVEPKAAPAGRSAPAKAAPVKSVPVAAVATPPAPSAAAVPAEEVHEITERPSKDQGSGQAKSEAAAVSGAEAGKSERGADRPSAPDGNEQANKPGA
jgi:hypothetical protein